jgi:hypothetical protein
MIRNFISIIMALMFAGLIIGCAPQMKKEGGFLEDYSKLEIINDNWSRWKDPSFTKATCPLIIVDPIQFNLDDKDRTDFSAEERREIREYAQTAFLKVVSNHVQVVTQPGPGVCRLRVAFTDLEKSAALMNLHPLSRATGAGRGGAALEAMVLDTESNKVIGMMTRTATGEFFEGSGMGSLSDIKSAIDRWSADADEKFEANWWGS